MTVNLSLAQRKPARITITVPHGVHEQLLQRSGYEGRSISNLASFLLERALAKDSAATQNPVPKHWAPSY
jgi:hypothetical protein